MLLFNGASLNNIDIQTPWENMPVRAVVFDAALSEKGVEQAMTDDEGVFSIPTTLTSQTVIVSLFNSAGNGLLRKVYI